MSENGSRVRLVQPSSPLEESVTPPSAASSIPIPARAALHGLCRHQHLEEQMRANDGEVVLPQSVYRKIMVHLSSDTERELGGLLVGTEIQGYEGRPTILIQDALPARHTRSHQTRLNFTEDTWAEFNRELDALEAQGVKLQRVGWYHSHPRMPIFLSCWDLDVCREFRRPTQVALVIDPCEPKGGFFVQGPQGFRDHAPQGFWEMKDLTPDSVVRWSSVNPMPELPASFLLGWLVPGNTLRPVEQEDPLSPSPHPFEPPLPPSNPRLSQWLPAAAMLLAILALATVWWNQSDRARSEQALQEHDKKLASLSGDVRTLNDTLADLINKQQERLALIAPPTPVVPSPRREEPPSPPAPKLPPTPRREPKKIVITKSEPTPGKKEPVVPDARTASTDPGPAPVPSPAPAPEAATPAPVPEPQKPEASPPAPAVATPQVAAPDPQPAHTPEGNPPPSPGPPNPPAHQGENGSHHGSQGGA